VKLKNLVPGSYVFELNAADGHGNVSTDKVTINVSSVPTGKTQVGSGVIAASGKSAILYSDNTWL
jgi:hypothetical protein